MGRAAPCPPPCQELNCSDVHSLLPTHPPANSSPADCFWGASDAAAAVLLFSSLCTACSVYDYFARKEPRGAGSILCAPHLWHCGTGLQPFSRHELCWVPLPHGWGFAPAMCYNRAGASLHSLLELAKVWLRQEEELLYRMHRRNLALHQRGQSVR